MEISVKGLDMICEERIGYDLWRRDWIL